MTEPVSTAASLDIRRHVIRLGGAYFLDTVGLVTEAIDQDLISAMLFLAIARDNVRDLTQAGQAQGEYAALDDIPPDTLRTPVSVYAVAREMNLPYETARRYVAKLIKAGLCERVRDGIVVPGCVYQRPALRQATIRNWERTLAFLGELAQVGLVRAPGRLTSQDQRRQVIRLSTEFLLDEMAMLAKTIASDPANALLYVAVVRANTWHLTIDPELSLEYAGLDSIPPDEARRPVSTYAMARSLRIPYETTRRYALRLEQAGLVERTAGGGLVVPARVHALPALKAGTDAYYQAVCGYLDRLAALGVTAASV